MEVSYLPEPEAHPLWPGIQTILKPAADYGEIPVFGDGEQVWIAHENGTVFGAATTLLWNDGEAELRLAGGTRFREWIGLLDEVLTKAMSEAGASKLTMRGRKGWGRFARPFGWVALGHDHDGRRLYEKEL